MMEPTSDDSITPTPSPTSATTTSVSSPPPKHDRTKSAFKLVTPTPVATQQPEPSAAAAAGAMTANQVQDQSPSPSYTPPLASPSSTTSTSTAPVGAAVPEPVSKFCSYCEERPATVWCESCSMNLCTPNGCDLELHAMKGRTHHVREPIQMVNEEVVPKKEEPAQPVDNFCTYCEERPATIWCEGCSMKLCAPNGCDQELHSQKGRAHHTREPWPVTAKSEIEAPVIILRPTNQQHVRRASAAAMAAHSDLTAPPHSALLFSHAFTHSVCDHCQSHEASLYCDECVMILCQPECDQDVHQPKEKRDHKRVPFPLSSNIPATPMCTHCESHLCEINCDQCQQSFCQHCDQEVHQHKAKVGHTRRALLTPSTTDASVPPTLTSESTAATPTHTNRIVPMCDHCHSHIASVECVDCQQYVCQPGCDGEVHARPGNGQHARIALEIGSPASSKRSSQVKPSVERKPSRAAEAAHAQTNSPPMSPKAASGKQTSSSSPSTSTAPISSGSKISIPTDVCDQCQKNVASLYCDECVMILCQSPCDRELHQISENRSHQRIPYPIRPKSTLEQIHPTTAIEANKHNTPSNLLCDTCSGYVSSIFCKECNLHLCSHCDEESHRQKGKTGHQRRPIQPSPTLNEDEKLPNIDDEIVQSNLTDSSHTKSSSTPDDGLPPMHDMKPTASTTQPTSPSSRRPKLPSGSPASISTKKPAPSSKYPSSSPSPKVRSSSMATNTSVSPGNSRPGTSGGPGAGESPSLRAKSKTRTAKSVSVASASSMSEKSSASGTISPSIETMAAGAETSGSPSSSDRDKAGFTSTGDREKDKVNYNYVLYSLRNKVTKLEEALELEQQRNQRAEEQIRTNYDAFQREQMRRKEFEAALTKERAESAALAAQAKRLESETDVMRQAQEARVREVEEQREKRAQEQQKQAETMAALEKQVVFHSTISSDKTNEITRLKLELGVTQEKLAEKEATVKKEKELNATYRSYSQKYEELILTLREKLGESERKLIAQAKWKLKANQYAEEWEQERKKMKRKIAKQIEMLDSLRKDLKDYRAILKFVSVKGYVNQWLLRRALKKLFIHAAEMSTANLIEQTEATPRVHNSVQLDTLEDLGVRNNKLLSEYPWGHLPSSSPVFSELGNSSSSSGPLSSNNSSSIIPSSHRASNRFPPLIALVRSIDTQLHVASEAGSLIRVQKRKWQETADSFFQRNIELTNSYLLSDQELMITKKKSSALRSHTKALQQKHQELEAALSTALLEKHRVEVEIEAIERTAKQEKALVNVIHAKKFERSVELQRRCITLETELKQLQQQREKMANEVAEASENKQLIQQVQTKKEEELAQDITIQQQQQQQLLSWNTRTQLGISHPTRGMATNKLIREVSPIRNPSQTVHPVATPQPPPDAFEQKTQPQLGVGNPQPPLPPNFNFYDVSRPVTAAFPHTAPAGPMVPGPSGFFYPVSAATGAPVIARSTGRPVTSPMNPPNATNTPMAPQPTDFKMNPYAYNGQPMTPGTMFARPPPSGSLSARPATDSDRLPPRQSSPSSHGRTKSPAYIMPILAAYQNASPSPSRSRSNSRPSSSRKQHPSRGGSSGTYQANVDSLNRSILDQAMMRAQRRSSGGLGKGQTLHGRHAAGSRAAHIQAVAIRKSQETSNGQPSNPSGTASSGMSSPRPTTSPSDLNPSSPPPPKQVESLKSMMGQA